RNCRRREAGNAHRLAKRFGSDRRQSLDRFAREPWNAVKAEVAGDMTRLLAPQPLDGFQLTPQVSFVSVNRLETREIDERILNIKRELSLANKLTDIHAGLTERPLARHPLRTDP